MLGMIASVLVIIGLVLLFLGGITFLVAAFRESLVWGLLVLFVPFASLVFLILHWSRARDPFFLQLWGLAFVFGAALLANNSLPWPLH